MRVWFVTGAGRGMGASIVRAALAVGDVVVATARHPEELAAVFGGDERVHPVRLDVTSVDQAASAAAEAVDRFGRIDVLVNNAGVSFKGFFEEMSPGQVEQQLATNLIGPMNVTRAVLPVMRRQRSGHLIAISSGAGLVGFPYSSVYAASKFGLEGWMGALAQEVEPFGIRSTIVNPGFFRTGLTSPESMIWPDVVVDDYAERSAEQRRWWQSQDGQQPGDPDKLAAAIVSLVNGDSPTSRLIGGADVIALAERKVNALQQQIDDQRSRANAYDFEP